MSKNDIFEILICLLIGAIIGAGFTLGGMTDPGNVVGFLDFRPGWRPLLLGVLGGAVMVSLAGFQYARRMGKPWFETSFPNLSNNTIDRKLVIGSVLFGLGWGMVGYCPGPAIVSAAAGNTEAVVFVLAMIAGGVSFQLWQRFSNPK